MWPMHLTATSPPATRPAAFHSPHSSKGGPLCCCPKRRRRRSCCAYASSRARRLYPPAAWLEMARHREARSRGRFLVHGMGMDVLPCRPCNGVRLRENSSAPSLPPEAEAVAAKNSGFSGQSPGGRNDSKSGCVWQGSGSSKNSSGSGSSDGAAFLVELEPF